MLVLTRKLNEAIVIEGNIRVTVVSIRGNQIRLGIEAPHRIGIYREELGPLKDPADRQPADHAQLAASFGGVPAQ